MRDLTPGGHAALDTLRSDDADQVRAVLRWMDPGDLHALAGTGASRAVKLTPDSRGTVAVADIAPSPTAVAEAAQQRDLRQHGAGLVLATLRAYGQRYDSHGVGLSPWATGTGTLGFVGPHTGHAVATDLPLPAEVVQACTLPEPRRPIWPPGPPPAYDGPAAPDGWVRLDHVDVREDLIPPTQPAELAEPPKARIVWWGLRTAYGEAGMPGVTTIAGGALSHAAAFGGVGPYREPAGMRPADWPMDAATRARFRRVGLEWLEAAARHLAAEAGTDATDALADPGTPWDTAVMVAGHPGPVDPHGVVATACRRAGITAVAAACGGLDQLSTVRGLLRQLLVPRLRPAAAALDGQVERLYDVLVPVAEALADQTLAPLATQARATAEAMVAAYYHAGPVPVDIPLYPGRLVPGPDDPVGATEVAVAAGVDRETVGAWQRRHGESFPQPRWMVGGRPAWRWGDVDEWIRATGRG